jgi:hypothetical protein
MRPIVEVVALVPVVLLVLWLFLSFGRGRKPEIDSLQTEPFTINPFVSWFILAGSVFFAAIFVFVSYRDLVSDPSRIPTFVFLGEGLFIGCVALGMYCLTFKIYVNETNVTISSLFGSRHVALRDIASVVVEDNVQWRTLYAYDARKKRVLYISSALSRFDDLADVLSERAANRIQR